MTFYSDANQKVHYIDMSDDNNLSHNLDVYDVDGNKVDVKIDKMTVYQNMLYGLAIVKKMRYQDIFFQQTYLQKSLKAIMGYTHTKLRLTIFGRLQNLMAL